MKKQKNKKKQKKTKKNKKKNISLGHWADQKGLRTSAPLSKLRCAIRVNLCSYDIISKTYKFFLCEV